MAFVGFVVSKQHRNHSLNSVVTLRVLTVRLKAWFRFWVRVGGSGKFGDPYSAKVPRSSVFEGRLARNGVPETTEPMSILCGRRRAFGAFRPFEWQVQGIGSFFIRLAGVTLSASCQHVGSHESKSEVLAEAIFRGRRSIWWFWRTCQGLASLVLWNCRHWGLRNDADDDCVWHPATATLLIFPGRGSTSETSTKSGWNQGTTKKHRFDNSRVRSLSLRRRYLCKRPLGKIPAGDLHARSLCKISIGGVHARSLGKTSVQEVSKRDLLARSK